MKLKFLEYAQRNGIERIKTENATTNAPMLAINMKIGIQERSWLDSLLNDHMTLGVRRANLVKLSAAIVIFLKNNESFPPSFSTSPSCPGVVPV